MVFETFYFISTVLRALKSRSARLALTQELAIYAKSRPRLDNHQFDYLSRLINCSLTVNTDRVLRYDRYCACVCCLCYGDYEVISFVSDFYGRIKWRKLFKMALSSLSLK